MDAEPRGPSVSVTAAALWFAFALVAALVGVARETWLVPLVGELRAHQLGTILVCGIFLALIAAFVRRVQPSTRQAASVGAAWTAAAVLFEFGFGHYVDGLSWERLFSDYDLTRGRLLVLLWLVLAAGPVVITCARQRAEA